MNDPDSSERTAQRPGKKTKKATREGQSGKRKSRISKISQCIRRTAATVPLKRTQMPDSPSFKPSELTPEMSGKFMKLLAQIKDLDAQDKAKHGTYFKHFIFTDLRDGNTGAKALAAYLIGGGFELSMGHQGKKIKRDGVYQETKKGDTRFLEGPPVPGGSNRFAMLQSVPLWKNPLSVETKKEILNAFNRRPGNKEGKPANINGEVVRIAILDSKYKEGIDLFDVKYVHLMEPAIAKSDLKQAIGRATRYCGQQGLRFLPNRGWPLEVFIYELELARGNDKPVGAHDLMMEHSGLDLALLQLTTELTVLAIETSVDYGLNYKINNFKIEEAILGAEDLEPIVVEVESVEAPLSGKKGGARKKPVVAAIHTPSDITPALLQKCFHRKNKLFPFSRAHMETVATRLGIKHAKSAKRPRLCQLIMDHPTYLNALLTTPPASAKQVKQESPLSLRAATPESLRSLPVGDLIQSLSKKSTTSADERLALEGLRHMFATPPSPASVDSIASREALTPESLRSLPVGDLIQSLSKKSTTSADERLALEGLRHMFATPPESITSQEALSVQSPRSIPKADLIQSGRTKSTTSKNDELALAPMRYLFATPPEPSPKKGSTPSLRDVSHLPFSEFQETVTQRFAEFAWKAPPVKNGCGSGPPAPGTVIDFTKTQDFVQHYLTPESPFKGLLLWHSVGTGKTCAAVAATGRFEEAGYRLLWVTRNALLSDLYKNVFGSVCSLPIRKQIKDGLVLPAKLSAQKRLLSSHWAPPITYRTFQNALEKKNELGHAMYRRNADPLYKTFIVLDEVHKLQDGDLSPSESASFEKIKAFLHKSYAVSGADSVRILFMTATPITDTPKELFEIVNALIPNPKDRLMDFGTYRSRFTHPVNGSISKEGRDYYQERAKGLISYLNREYDPSTFSIPHFNNVAVRLPTMAVPTLTDLTSHCLEGVSTPSPDVRGDCDRMEREMEREIDAVTGRTAKERTSMAAAIRKTYKARIKECRAATKKSNRVGDLLKGAMKCYRETKKDFTRRFKGSQQATIEECFTGKVKKGTKEGKEAKDAALPSSFVDKDEFEEAVRKRLTRKMPPAAPKAAKADKASKADKATKAKADKRSPTKKNPRSATRSNTYSFNSTGAVMTPLKD